MNLNKKLISKALFDDEDKYRLMDIEDFEDNIIQKLIKSNKYDNIPKFTCTYIDSNNNKKLNTGFLTIEEFAHWYLMLPDTHTHEIVSRYLITSLVSVINFNDIYEVTRDTISKNGQTIAKIVVEEKYKTWQWLGETK
jgi:hypothetical protein